MPIDDHNELPAHCLSPSFVDNLPEPFLSIARDCIPVQGSSDLEELKPAAQRADTLEVKLRTQLLNLAQEALERPPQPPQQQQQQQQQDEDENEDDDALADVALFWKCSLELCLHFVYFCEQGSDERYKGMSVRKLPLLLLEDFLDSLPLESFKQIWESTVEPSFSILFSDIMWKAGGQQQQQSPCALPFIKLCNKLLRKLNVEKGSAWPGRILLTLADVFPLSDKSATKVWGSFNTDNVTEFETEEEFEQQKQQEQEQESELLQTHTHQQQHKQLQHQTYSFYEAFWSVQKDFSNPTGIKVADFLERMRTILAALESHPLIRSNKKGNGGVKYLTGSHLLPIQLGDPEFRIHFLTQFLIVEKHLSSEIPALAASLVPLQKRAKDLMYHIQPHGATHLQILDTILNDREKYWRQWKKNKCQPDMETPLVKQQDDEKNSNSSKKRKLLMDGPLGGGGDASKRSETAKDEEQQLIDFINEKKDLKSTCALTSSQSPLSKEKPQERRGSFPSRNTRSKVVPSLEEHLEPYVDALDPDAGIEAEFHPKNDHLFTWRALRLLSRDHLQHFHMINHKGDFERMVRHIYKEEKGIEIPGDAPVEEHPSTVMETTEEEPPNDEENDEGAGGDQDMEDQDMDRRSLDDQEEDHDNGEDRLVDSRPETPAEGTPHDNSVVDEQERGDEPYVTGEESEQRSTPAPMDVERASAEDAESDGPTREREGHDSDEGEIEEGKVKKGSVPPSPVEQEENPNEGGRGTSGPSASNAPERNDGPRRRGGSKDRQEDRRDRHEDDKRRSDDSRSQRRGGDGNRRSNQQQDQRTSRPPSPGHRGGGRDSRRPDGPPLPPSARDNQKYSSHESGRGGSHRGPRGGGGHRDSGPPQGGGRPSSSGGRRDDRRGMDDRERREDRRGAGGGGGGGPPDRRGDKRGGGGPPDRRDRRGGRGRRGR